MSIKQNIFCVLWKLVNYQYYYFFGNSVRNAIYRDRLELKISLCLNAYK